MKTYLLISLLFVQGALASSLTATQIRPLSPKISFLPQNKLLTLNQSALLQFNSLAGEAKLPMISSPKEIGYNVQFDLLATDEKLRRSILLSANYIFATAHQNKIYKNTNSFMWTTSLGRQNVSIIFAGFEEKEVISVITQFNKLHSRMPSNLDVAGSPDGSLTNETPSEGSVSKFTYALGESFAQCGLGIVEGMNAVLVDPFVSAAKSVYGGVTSPKAWWEGSLKQLDTLYENLKNFDSYAEKTWSDFRRKSPTEKSKLYCSFAGGGGGSGLATKALAKTTSTTAKITNAEAAMQNVVQTNETLIKKVAAAKPPKTTFVKDQPTLAYKIKSNKFEDIPEVIRKELGAVDKTKYTPEYLEKNIGSVIALQVNGAKSDFYIIGKDTFITKYKSASISDVETKNPKYLKSLNEIVPGATQDPGVVAVLKTTPTDMIKMSDIGYKIKDPVTIKSPWGEQTKPAGQDGYLVWDASKNQYYMCNVDSKGNPLSYIPRPKP